MSSMDLRQLRTFDMETSASSLPDPVAMAELVVMVAAADEAPKPHDTKLSPVGAWER
jgi:hypothetical protein